MSHNRVMVLLINKWNSIMLVIMSIILFD